MFLRSHFVNKKSEVLYDKCTRTPSEWWRVPIEDHLYKCAVFSSDRDLLLQARSIRGSKRTLLEQKTWVNYARKADTGQNTRFVQQP